jgi:hypothetical protein
MTKGKPLPVVTARAWEQNVRRALFSSILHRSSTPCQIMQTKGNR